MDLSRAVPLALAGALTALTACTGGAGADAVDARPPSAVSSTSPPALSTAPGARAGPDTDTDTARRTDPRTESARMSIPAIGVGDLRVVPYEGTTDDRAGTRIQDRGLAASPYGPEGGVGPGEIGNYLVTAHRLSAGGPLRELPDLRKGDRVTVVLGGRFHEYEITGTRWTSFRSERSLAEQRAAVPGHPGEPATRAMITISTCATPEDDAAGNFWRDGNNNPEHRIDKIGVLKRSGTA
ncbi:class E sortase [Streptomyces sp. NPDC051018]|uniref:class E sortase n=1 Tax=Streptomyces sp. NPDC051018 TaxID=3365639 RepID=UPI0037961B7A